jgi:hypothetical protein
MMLLLLLACTGKAEDTGYRTSDLRAELSGPGTSACIDDELKLQIGFVSEVPRVEAEIHDGSGLVEFHDVPFKGMDEDTNSIFIHEATLATGSDTSDDTHTKFTCDPVPYPAFRIFDDEGALMGCYVGDAAAFDFDMQGCPEE